KMLMPALAHEIPDALIHRDARRSYQARHASHNAVIARGNHVGACAKNGNELEHVVVIGSEDWNSRQRLLDIAARNRVQPFHSDEYRKNAVTLAKRLKRLRKAGNVVLILFL